MTMSGSLFAVFVLLFTYTVFADEETKKYTTKYDNIDLEDLVQNDRLLRNYVDCLLDQGSCTPDGMELKRECFMF